MIMKLLISYMHKPFFKKQIEIIAKLTSNKQLLHRTSENIVWVGDCGTRFVNLSIYFIYNFYFNL